MRKIGVNCCVPRARAPHQSGAAAPQARKKLAILRIYAEFRVAGLQLWLGRTARDHSIHVKCHKTHTLMHATYARHQRPGQNNAQDICSSEPQPRCQVAFFCIRQCSRLGSACPASCPPRALPHRCRGFHTAARHARAGRPRRAASAQELLCLRRLPLHWMAQQRADCWLDAGSVQICSSTGEWPVPVNNEMGKQTEENEVRRPEAGGCCSARGGLSSLSRQGALTSCVSRFAHSSWAA